MSPLNDDTKLQFGDNNKNWKNWKIVNILKKYNIINFNTIRYILTALDNIIQSSLN